MKKIIKLSSPCLGEEEIENLRRVLETGQINMGAETKAFESELTEFFKEGRTDDIYVNCVNSCTAALQLALQAAGIGPGDEVLAPTFTFVASFQAISATGARPIPCDVDLDDVFISLDDARSRVTPNTKAIMPVLFASCDRKIDKVYDFAKEFGLAVIEDAAHSFGSDGIAKRDGLLCFSFDAIKNITCSDGGCVVTKDKVLSDFIKDARLLGVIGDTDSRFEGKRTWDPDVREQGWRYHMSNVCSAIGRAQLAKFPMFKERRKSIARRYQEELADLANIRLLPINIETTTPHIFPIIVGNGKRDDLKKFLMERGIETGVQYKPNHLLSYYYLGYSLPNSIEIYDSILSLPIHPLVTDEDTAFIVECIEEFC